MKKILLADDDPTNCKVTSLRLEKIGHKVDVASNGFEAVQFASENEYDVILMDIAMPLMDGIEACAVIRNIPDIHKSTVKVIAFTANASQDFDEKLERANFDGVIKKPALTQDILEAIDAVAIGDANPKD